MTIVRDYWLSDNFFSLIWKFRIGTVWIRTDFTGLGSPIQKDPAADYRDQRNKPVFSRFAYIMKTPPAQCNRGTQNSKTVCSQRNIVMPFAGESPDKNKYHSHNKVKQNKIPVFASAGTPLKLSIF